MKNKYLLIMYLFVGLLCFNGCGDDEYKSIESEYGTATLNPADALLNVNSQVLSFQAGTESYNLNFDLVNGDKKVTSLNVYSVFTDAGTGDVSEKVLFNTYAVGNDLRTNFSEDITYDQLKSGITVNGGSLPDDQTAVAIGSGWLLTFEGLTADGAVIPFSGQTRVAVLSRFAGIYEVIESGYFRIGEDNGGWNGGERFIGSVDETTYSYNDFWGNFGWVGNSFTFSIDANNDIIVPLLDADGQLANGNALFSGNRGVGCHTDAGHFANVPCAGSNILEIDDVNGKHVIRLTYGYFTDGSGPREFYEVLQKK